MGLDETRLDLATSIRPMVARRLDLGRSSANVSCSMAVRAGLAVAPSGAAIDPAAVSPNEDVDVAEGNDGEVGDVLPCRSPVAVVGDDREVLRVEDAANSDGILRVVGA